MFLQVSVILFTEGGVWSVQGEPAPGLGELLPSGGECVPGLGESLPPAYWSMGGCLVDAPPWRWHTCCRRYASLLECLLVSIGRHMFLKIPQRCKECHYSLKHHNYVYYYPRDVLHWFALPTWWTMIIPPWNSRSCSL